MTIISNTRASVAQAAALATLALVPPARSAPAQTAAREVSLERLALDITVDYGRAALAGRATLTVRNQSAAPLGVVPLLLNRLMSATRASDGAGRALKMEQKVGLFEDDSLLQVNEVALHLARPLPSGDSVSVRVDWSGRLVGYTETGSLYIRDRIDSAFTILRMDAFAYPWIGRPSHRALRAAGQTHFAYQARVTVPRGQVVTMGGTLTGRVDADSQVTWSYESSGPAPFLNIAIAPYARHESPAVSLYYFPADSLGARRLAERLQAGMQLLERWFGAPRERAPLVVMEIPDAWGSQADVHAGVILTADAFAPSASLVSLYHELTHLWNPPDSDQPSGRWNEGLASFLQWRMAEALDAWTDWDGRVARTVQTARERCGARGQCSTTPMRDYGTRELTDFSYLTGFLMFYALHRVMGDASFDLAYRTLLDRSRATGAGSSDLVEAFVSRDPRSRKIFDEWLLSPAWYTRVQDGAGMRSLIEGYARK